jgi:hypothetical protein
MTRVAFVTYAEFPLLYENDKLAADLLRAHGVEVEAVLWDSAEVRWEEFDAVVLRSCWGSVARIILRQAKSFLGFHYAATWKRLSTNFAWPIALFLSNLFTCPFLIIFIDSIPSSVRSAV